MSLLINAIGRLGSDPEERETKNGTKFISLNLACSTRAGGQATTTWVRCTIWNSSFDGILKYLKKGSMIVVSGEMNRISSYINKDNEPSSSLEINVSGINFVPGSKKSDDEGQSEELDDVNMEAISSITT